MRERLFRMFSTGLAGFLILLVWSYGLWELRANPEWSTTQLAALGGLLAGASLTARLWALRSRGPLPRLAPSFVLAGLLALPPPGGLLAALVAALAGRGGGVLGPPGRGTHSYASTALAVALAQAASGAVSASFVVTSLWGLLGAALLFAMVQLPALLLGELFRGGGALTGDAPPTASWRVLAQELANVPLAWVLAALLASGAGLQAGALGLTIVGAQLPLLRLARTSRDLRRTHRDLASRRTELEILHAIGREILASLDLERICSVVDRECRKIFDHDFGFIALAQPEGKDLRFVYRALRGQPPLLEPAALDPGLTTWIGEERRGLRFDDLANPPRHLPRLEPGAPGLRSALVAPMVVEERLIGVLSVQSRAEQAYDDHQLTLLTTVAQQAAVAIESVRHHERATVDSLTAFFLRDYFFRRLEDEHRRTARYGGRFSLLMLDLDGFKAINDDHGHMAGDRYLAGVGRAVRECLRAADLPCRYGGDEFCLLLPETDQDGARVIAERIREAVARLVVPFEGARLRTTVSIGLAAFPGPDAEQPRDLLRNADEALYRAKRAGRDCVVPFAA